MDLMLVFNVSARERLEILCWKVIAHYTYLWLHGGALFPVQLLLFLSYWHPWPRSSFPCAKSCPGARWEMLAPFTMSVGGVVEKRPCPKLVIGKAKPLPLGNSLVLVTVGTHRKTTWPGSKAPLLSESLIPHEICWMHSCPSAWQLHWQCTVFSAWWRCNCCISQSPSHCSGISPSEGTVEVWCGCRSSCRSQPERIPPMPCVPPRSFC